jgi:hypothetical protein
MKNAFLQQGTIFKTPNGHGECSNHKLLIKEVAQIAGQCVIKRDISQNRKLPKI